MNLRSSGPVALAAVMLAAAAVASLYAGRYGAYLVHSVAIAAIGALALNLLTGYCGQISLAHGALMGVGAYAGGLAVNAGWDVAAFIVAGVVTAGFSVLIGLPALRLKGLYFAISTMAAQFILEYLFKTLQPVTQGVSGLPIAAPRMFGIEIASDQAWAVTAIVVLGLTWAALAALLRTHLGRAMRVVRESELVARGMGIDVPRTKLWTFLVSGFFTGIAGALMACTARLAFPETFDIGLSIHYKAMIIVGGLGSLLGSVIGAAFITLLPEAIQRVGEALQIADQLSAIREMAFGLLMILFLVLEPRGVVSLGQRLTPWRRRPPPTATTPPAAVALRT